MRAQHAFGSAREHTGDVRDQFFLAPTEAGTQQPHQALREIAAREIVDAAIPLRLANNGDDLAGFDGAPGDQIIQLGEISRMRHRKSEHARAHDVLQANFTGILRCECRERHGANV